MTVSRPRPIIVALVAAVLIGASALAGETANAQVASPDRPQGLIYFTATNIVAKETAISAETFLPRKTKVFRCVIVIGNQGDANGQLMYFDLARVVGQAADCGVMYLSVRNMTGPQPGRTPERESIRNAELGGAEGLLTMLDPLAVDSGHPELTKVPLLFWGFSSQAAFGVSFAQLYPERTLAFVRYHVHLRGLPRDRSNLTAIPALIIAGGKDPTAGVDDAAEMFRAGRLARAPWTFVVEPDAAHASPEIHAVTARQLTIPWMTAVIRQRLSASGQLQPIRAGWMGDPATGQIAPEDMFSGNPQNAVWLPDEEVAKGWQVVSRGGR